MAEATVASNSLSRDVAVVVYRARLVAPRIAHVERVGEAPSVYVKIRLRATFDFTTFDTRPRSSAIEECKLS